MFEGPEAELTLTANAQPALMAASIAALRVLETEKGFDVARRRPTSPGIRSANIRRFARRDRSSLEDTARLLRLRGEAMQKAVPVGEGAMAAILGLDFGAVVKIATQAASDLYLTGAICQAANDNGGGQVVDLGHEGGGRARDGARQARWREAGVASAGLGAVSFRAHAARRRGDGGGAEGGHDPRARSRRSSPMSKPRRSTDPEAIRSDLVAQVTGTVRWRESVAYMSAHGVTRFIEVGAGKVLAGLIKRIAEGATAISIGAPADIAAFERRRSPMKR